MSQLKNYVEKELSRGFSIDVIKRKLLSSGYDEQEIDETFSIIKQKPDILVREQHIQDSRNRLNTHLKKTNLIFATIVIIAIFALSYLIVTYYVAYDQKVESIPFISDIKTTEDSTTQESQITVEEGDCPQANFECFYNKALETGNSEYCQGTTRPIECEIEISTKFNNANLCTYDECSISFALENNYPEACENLESEEKERCYLRYSVEFNDGTYCPENLFECQFKFGTNEEKQELVEELTETLGEKETKGKLINYAKTNDDSSACSFLPNNIIFGDIQLSHQDFCVFNVAYVNEDIEHCNQLSSEQFLEKCNNIIECKEQGYYLLDCLYSD